MFILAFSSKPQDCEEKAGKPRIKTRLGLLNLTSSSTRQNVMSSEDTH